MKGIFVGVAVFLVSGCGLIGYGGDVGEEPDDPRLEDPDDPVSEDPGSGDPSDPLILPSPFACGVIASSSPENIGELQLVRHDSVGFPMNAEEVERERRLYYNADCSGGVAFSLVTPSSAVTFADVLPGEIIEVPAITSADVLGVITVAAAEPIFGVDTYEFATGCQTAETTNASQAAPAVITSDCVSNSDSVDILAVAKNNGAVHGYDYLLGAPAPSGGEVLNLGALDGWESGLRGTMVSAINSPGYFITSFQLTQSHWRSGRRFVTETSTAQNGSGMYHATQLAPPLAFSSTTSALATLHFFGQEVIGVSANVSQSSDPIDLAGHLEPFEPTISVNGQRTLISVGYDDPLNSTAVVMISAERPNGFRGAIFARAESVVTVPLFPPELDAWGWLAPGAGDFAVSLVESPSENYSTRIEHAADITAFRPPLERVLFTQHVVDND